jgi:hypothetical protein
MERLGVRRCTSGILNPHVAHCSLERRRLGWEHEVDPGDADGVTRMTANAKLAAASATVGLG